MDKTCYTAIFSNYEDLKDPSVPSPGWKFICFTDQDLSSDVWEIVKIVPDREPQRMARKIKLLFHKYIESEFSLWLDASFQINIDLNVFWNKVFKAPFSCPEHPIRNCVYREVQSCLANQRGDADQLIAQEIRYRQLKVPAFNGIITSGVLLRQRTEVVMKLCEAWHEELEGQSVRDQISYAFVVLRFPRVCNTFKWDYSQSKELKYVKHFKHRH